MAFRVTGTDQIRDTAHALQRYADLLPAAMSDELAAVGAETRDRAKNLAALQGLFGYKYNRSRDPHPGRLIDRIRYSPARPVKRVSIIESAYSSSAKYPRYSYPRRYEYGATDDTRRPFMRPAAEQERPLLAPRFEAMLERVKTEAGF